MSLLEEVEFPERIHAVLAWVLSGQWLCFLFNRITTFTASWGSEDVNTKLSYHSFQSQLETNYI